MLRLDVRQLVRQHAIVQLSEARPGDVAFFARGKKLIGHVELVTELRILREGGEGGFPRLELHSIGGNVANAVRRQVRLFEPIARLGKLIEYTPSVVIARWPV